MNNAERVALADAAIAAEKGGEPLTFTVPGTPEGDTAVPSASDKPAAVPVTPQPVAGEAPGKDAGPEVTQTPVAETPIEFPTWVTGGTKEVLRGLSKEQREVVIRDMDAKRVSLEQDATTKWTEAAEVKKDADRWRRLRDDPVRGPKVLEILETADAPAVDPRVSMLKETLGDDVATAVLGLIDAGAESKARAVVHQRVDAPNEHVKHVNAAADAAAKELGLTAAEYATARKQIGSSLGYTEADPLAPYAALTTANVRSYLALAAISLRANAPAPAAQASPPSPPVAKPASVQSNGMALGTKTEPAWRREKRMPRLGEQAADTMRRNGLTDADVDRLMRTM